MAKDIVIKIGGKKEFAGTKAIAEKHKARIREQGGTITESDEEKPDTAESREAASTCDDSPYEILH